MQHAISCAFRHVQQFDVVLDEVKRRGQCCCSPDPEKANGVVALQRAGMAEAFHDLACRKHRTPPIHGLVLILGLGLGLKEGARAFSSSSSSSTTTTTTTTTFPSPLLKHPRIHHTNHHQTRHDQRRRHARHQKHAAPARRKLAPDDPILALEIPPPAHEQDQNGDSQKSGAQWFADLAEVGGCGGVVGEVAAAAVLVRFDGCVEAEELCDGYADGGEGEGGAEPG